MNLRLRLTHTPNQPDFPSSCPIIPKTQLESLDPTGFASSVLKDKDAWQTSGTATLTHITVPPKPASGNSPATKGSNAVRLSAPGHAQLVNTGHSLTGFFVRAGSSYELTITSRAPEVGASLSELHLAKLHHAP